MTPARFRPTCMKMIQQEGEGLIIYSTPDEGRGIGIFNKINTMEYMDRTGRNTADAFTDLGYPADSRTFTHGVEILRDLKNSQVKLITNNPNKIENLSEFGKEVVQRVPLVSVVR